MSEHNRAIVERFLDEVWNKKNIAIADELLPDEVILHNFGAVAKGREAWRQTMGAFFKGFPDLTLTVEFTLADGDKVAARWTLTGTHTDDFRGIAATGKAVEIAGVAIGRVDGGRIVEIWSQPDTLGLLQQIGAIPG